MGEVHDGKPIREFADVFVRVRVLDRRAVTMEIKAFESMLRVDGDRGTIGILRKLAAGSSAAGI